MKKLLVTALAGAALLIGIAALFVYNSTTPNAANSSNSTSQISDPSLVTIHDFSFDANSIKIKKGTTVTWTNKDDAHHDITPTSGPDDFRASELLAKGETYQFTFNTVGTYTYKCSPHPYMKGTIEVVE